MLHQPNLTVNAAGHLALGGVDTVALAEKYGTPLYVLDEDMIRSRMGLYKTAMTAYLPAGSRPLYASKAMCCKALCRAAMEEGMGLDTVSAGELYTALAAGFPPSGICCHGNAKTDEELRYAIQSRVGCIVADGEQELARIDRLCGQMGLRQSVLLRVTPGIDPHTFAAVNTGVVDVKFGVPIPTGQALAVTGAALKMPHIDLEGFHCHIGSQIFDAGPFRLEVDVMLSFLDSVRRAYGYTAGVLNLGGGFAVPYEPGENAPDCGGMIRQVGEHLASLCRQYDYPAPAVMMEPGRGIVAAAGITLYTVQNVKTVPGGSTYVAVDGGMGDNPRYALYRARHSAVLASRAGEPEDCAVTIAGRCCESGDLIGENVPMHMPQAGDILAVLVTGAYTYSMASNYNRVPRPPVVALRGGQDRLIVRRETLQDVAALDLWQEGTE